MKRFKLSTLIFAFAIALLASSFAIADATYPYTNPTYIPNAVSPAISYAAPADYYFTPNGIGTVSLRVTGTCTSLAAVLQASNDSGTNWTAINLYPIATGTTAPVAVASISAVGFWKANSLGYNKLRLHITALTATCTIAMSGTPGSFNGTQF